MELNKLIFPSELYKNKLKLINNIAFTQREIDVISFFVSGRPTKKIATFFSITPKTVEYHTQKIMQKLGCNSRDAIVDFIEKSDKFSAIKRYYTNILAKNLFEKSLGALSIFAKDKNLSCSIMCFSDQDSQLPLISFLRDSLKQTNIACSIEVRKEAQSFVTLLKESKGGNYQICVLPPDWIGGLPDDGELATWKPVNIIFLLLRKEIESKIPEKLKAYNVIEFSEQVNIYESVWDVLIKIFPYREFNAIRAEFKEKCKTTLGMSEHYSTPSIVKEIAHQAPLQTNFPQALSAKQAPLFFNNALLKKLLKLQGWHAPLFFSGICLLGFIFIRFNILFLNQEDFESSHAVRSDLFIPAEAVFLQRPDLIKKIADSLKGNKGIRTTALVGIGGAGKTTLARQYARQQRENVTWEINAETKSNLLTSFEELAYYLSTTEEEKNTLQDLKKIKDINEKEKKLLFFTAKKLKLSSPWLLIYDNVENLQSIRSSLPYDELVWGAGSVIITTRDSNIYNGAYLRPRHIINIQELKEDEKFSLFSEILHGEEAKDLATPQKGEVKSFLQEIPSFPLDVSAAAYYIKDTKIPYEEYLRRAKDMSGAFEEAQEDLLKETINYNKTRYGIITLVIDSVIKRDSNFKDLMLFISLLNSQNIPQELLKIYKEDTVVERFIHTLRKNSLINTECSIGGTEVFSFHRSTHEIIFVYLAKTLLIEKDKMHLFFAFIKAIEAYAQTIIWEEDIPRMKILKDHLEAFLKLNNLLPVVAKGYVSSSLGSIFTYLGDYVNAERYFKEGLVHLKPFIAKESIKVAWTMEQLAEVYSEIGRYKNAIALFENALALYKKELPVNYTNVARAASNLGYVYKEIGKYADAKELFSQSLHLYKQYDPENYVGIAWTLLYLGYLYQDIGDHKEAKSHYEQGLRICAQYLSSDHILNAWILSHLGNIYRELGNTKKAASLINEGLSIERDHII